MGTSISRLRTLGYSSEFSSQLTDEESRHCLPARVIAVHRNRLSLAGEEADQLVDVSDWPSGLEAPVVGDWLLMDSRTNRVVRLLQRTSLFQRIRPSTDDEIQKIAANVDTLFVVTSCNEEFNLSRLERYIALAQEAGVHPVVVLTKADLSEDAARYEEQAASLGVNIPLVRIDARSPASVQTLGPWLVAGKTIALLGSSGTGKSTLLNTLAGNDLQETSPVRASDQRGRHTTTSRSLHVLESGAVLIDSPGMRELNLVVTGDALLRAFADIEEIGQSCRFTDCRHSTEPGCAVALAVEHGKLPARRVANYIKLLAEQRDAAESREATRQAKSKR